MSPSTSQPSKKPKLPNDMPSPPRPPQPPTKPRTPFPPAVSSAAPPLHQHPILKPEPEQFDTSFLAAPPSKATGLFCCGDLGFVTVETNTWHWTLNKFVTTVYDLKSFPSNPISPWLGIALDRTSYIIKCKKHGTDGLLIFQRPRYFVPKLDKESGWIEVSAEIIKNDGAKYGEWKEEGSFMQYYCEEHGGPMYTCSIMQRDKGQSKESGKKRVDTKAFAEDSVHSASKKAKTSGPDPELGVEKPAVDKMVECGKGVVGLEEKKAKEGRSLRSGGERSLRKRVADKALGLDAELGKAKKGRSVAVEEVDGGKREGDREGEGVGMDVDG